MGGLVKADSPCLPPNPLQSVVVALSGPGRYLVCLDSTDSFAIIFNSCPSSGTTVVTAPVFPGFRVVVAGRYLVCRFNQLTKFRSNITLRSRLDPSKSGRKMG